jgi:hypothetical protein
VGVHRRWSQIVTVRAMTITADSLLSRPNCGCDGGYDVAVKGLNVVVIFQDGGSMWLSCINTLLLVVH